MVEGELLQMEKLGKSISEAEHLNLIFRKTACLFSVSMRLGALIGGASEEPEQTLGDYGRSLGMAFQIIDDVLDLTASEDVLGKPVASDLREGKATMAVIHALERSTPEERMIIETVLQKRIFEEIQPSDVVSILNRYKSIDYAVAAASAHAAAARQALSGFPDSEIKRALLWIPDFVLERDN